MPRRRHNPIRSTTTSAFPGTPVQSCPVAPCDPRDLISPKYPRDVLAHTFPPHAYIYRARNLGREQSAAAPYTLYTCCAPSCVVSVLTDDTSSGSRGAVRPCSPSDAERHRAPRDQGFALFFPASASWLTARLGCRKARGEGAALRQEA